MCVARNQINAPFVFQALYALMKQIIHPITVAKLEVCSADYHKRLAEAGVQLEGGALPPCDAHSPTFDGFFGAMTKLRAEVGDDARIVRGFLPDDDAEAMRRHGLLS